MVLVGGRIILKQNQLLVMELKWRIVLMYLSVLCAAGAAVRLHTLLQFLEGSRAEHRHRGFLHLGDQYAVFIRTPQPHDRHLTYELYEVQNINNTAPYQPSMLAASKIPIDYIKEQLVIFSEELYNAKHVDNNTVPGTRVKTLREWQLERALKLHDGGGLNLNSKPPILRTHL